MMKAAVLHQTGTPPRWSDFEEPVAGPGQVVAQVAAASIKNLDRMLASGSHYASKHLPLPRVVGVDGIVRLADGKLVYTGGGPGMMAERVAIDPSRAIPVPEGLDPAVAAALPNAALSAWFAMRGRAGLERGEKVLVLGATGVTGRQAVQIARRLGAGEIVAAGRNPKALAELPALGADAVISLAQDDAAIHREIAAEHAKKPFDLVLDYLWGRPAEITLDALTGHDLGAAGRRLRFVQNGEMAGATITLAGGTLRSSAIEISGQGGGSVPKELLAQVPTILPELFQAALEKKLIIDVERVPLSEVERVWPTPDQGGCRRVLMIGG